MCKRIGEKRGLKRPGWILRKLKKSLDMFTKPLKTLDFVSKKICESSIVKLRLILDFLPWLKSEDSQTKPKAKSPLSVSSTGYCFIDRSWAPIPPQAWLRTANPAAKTIMLQSCRRCSHTHSPDIWIQAGSCGCLCGYIHMLDIFARMPRYCQN